MIKNTALAELSELGKTSAYDSSYNPEKLFPIARQSKRAEIGIEGALPFYGFDLWNHYEVSWLNEKGKPIVALAEILYNCNTPNIIESKSLKLYFNSFNNSKFKDAATLKNLIEKDIAERIEGTVKVFLFCLPLQSREEVIANLDGECIDELDIVCDTYTVNPDYLTTHNEDVSEILHSNLLKSNCLVTNQPDWGSVQIVYRGKKINREGLLRYFVSFRNHNEFHEQCIERIYMDIMRQCKPEELTVYGRYTRRGGLDINPYRSSKKLTVDDIKNIRLCRQ
jgi:7-cyano-7-deazaguanine reductase